TRLPCLPSCASQLGSQAWLIQRASLPLSPPSITRPELSAKKNVWKGSSGLVGGRRSASLARRRSPPYSMMRVPAGILRAAKTPLPCSLERRTTCQGLEGSAVVIESSGERASGDYIDGSVHRDDGPARGLLGGRRRQRQLGFLQATQHEARLAVADAGNAIEPLAQQPFVVARVAH